MSEALFAGALEACLHVFVSGVASPNRKVKARAAQMPSAATRVVAALSSKVR